MKLPSSRRARTAALAIVLAAGGLLATPAPSSAAVLASPQTLVGVDFDENAPGGVTCNVSGAGDTSAAGTFAADGVPVTSTSTSSATYTNAGDAGDVTTLSGTATNTVRATQANGALSSVDVSASFQVAVNAARGAAQQCNADVQARAGDAFEFDLPTPRYLTVDIESFRAVGQLQLVNTTDNMDDAVFAQQIIYSPHFHDAQRVYLPAGHYQAIYQGFAVLEAPTATNGGATTRSGRLTFSLDFYEPGAAPAAAKGGAKKYLDLADGRTCATASLEADWKKKAGKGEDRKVKKATFFVNDVKVKTVRRPKRNQTTRLTGLDPEKAADVEVRLKLAKRGAGTLTLERTYLPCS